MNIIIGDKEAALNDHYHKVISEKGHEVFGAYDAFNLGNIFLNNKRQYDFAFLELGIFEPLIKSISNLPSIVPMPENIENLIKTIKEEELPGFLNKIRELNPNIQLLGVSSLPPEEYPIFDRRGMDEYLIKSNVIDSKYKTVDEFIQEKL